MLSNSIHESPTEFQVRKRLQAFPMLQQVDLKLSRGQAIVQISNVSLPHRRARER